VAGSGSGSRPAAGGRGPARAHDFGHTFATWLEDAGIPARVIDEVMGQEATSRAGQQPGSAMGAHYGAQSGHHRLVLAWVAAL
jgi:hypothetical protein